MVLPIGDEALQQIGASQQRAVRGSGASEGDVVAAAGAGVAAVKHEFFGSQAGLARFLVERAGGRHQFAPGCGGMNVDFDHARIRRDAEQAQMWIARRWIALDRYRNMHCARDTLNCAQQGDVFAGVLERRHEDVEVAFAHLNGERGLDHFPRFGAARASGR